MIYMSLAPLGAMAAMNNDSHSNRKQQCSAAVWTLAVGASSAQVAADCRLLLSSTCWSTAAVAAYLATLFHDVVLGSSAI